jgi:hypothetical protein
MFKFAAALAMVDVLPYFATEILSPSTYLLYIVHIISAHKSSQTINLAKIHAKDRSALRVARIAETATPRHPTPVV